MALQVSTFTASSHAIAENAIIIEHEALVRRLANKSGRVLPEGVSTEDLYQIGLIALVDAHRRYDSSCGASFETYARIRINGAMIDEIRRTAFGSRAIWREARRARTISDRIAQTEGRGATDSEVAEEMGLGLKQYHNLQMLSGGSQNVWEETDLFASGVADLDELQSDVLSPEEEVDQMQREKAFDDAMAALPERERSALSLYYRGGYKLREIGSVLGISESRACQLNASATDQLRNMLVQ